jgi:hypothetical protein
MLVKMLVKMGDDGGGMVKEVRRISKGLKWKWNVPKEVWTEDNFVWCKQFIMFIPKARATGKAIGTSFRTGESVENGTSELA